MLSKCLVWSTDQDTLIFRGIFGTVRDFHDDQNTLDQTFRVYLKIVYMNNIFLITFDREEQNTCAKGFQKLCVFQMLNSQK